MSNSPSEDKVVSPVSKLTLQAVRDRVVDEIVEALDDDQPTLIEALPGAGKSHGVVKAAKQTGQQISVFTLRGRVEQYDQYQKWCGDAGLDSYVLPSVREDCPTAKGDHDEESKQEIRELLECGVSPSHLHDRKEWPCQANGQCPYIGALDVDLDQYDVLLGHYTHANLDCVLEGRVPVFDEFPGEVYLTKLFSGDITAYLQEHQRIPFETCTDLIEHRDDDQRVRKAFTALKNRKLRDESLPLRQTGSQGHALSGLGVLTLLKSNDLGNGWEECQLGEGQIGLFNREENTVHVLDPPALSDNVVALDGTPTKDMWDLALGFFDRRGRSLAVQQILSDEERLRYVVDVQQITVVQTTSDARPYSSGTWATPQRDAALVTAIKERHNDNVGIISSTKGLEKLPVDIESTQTGKYGNVLGSGKLSQVDAGVILGSSHYGEDYLKRWCALAGIGAESNDEKGMDKSYGAFGDQVLQQMREHQVVQALFRFARHGDETTVYVDTGALPNWVPVAVEPADVDVWARPDGHEEILQALVELGEARTRTIADETGLSSRHVRDVLNWYCKRGSVSKRPAADGRGGANVYVDEELEALNPFGGIDLPDSPRPPHFSELPRIRAYYGRVPKNLSSSLNPQAPYREATRQQHRQRVHEAQRRRLRQLSRFKMEEFRSR